MDLQINHSTKNIKNLNVLCLDFNDCLFPSDRTLAINQKHKFDAIANNNFANVIKLIKYFNLKVFIKFQARRPPL